VTALAVVLCLICQLFLVVGQLLLKRAMNGSWAAAWPVTAWRLLPGIGCLTARFFLWLGLLQQWELSQVFPFEGLNPALLALAAWLFLKERIAAQAWIGIVLIAVGVGLVSAS
jgi:uncharacterized membrane protein